MASTPDATLDPRTAATLTAMARALYPHDSLDDAFYRRVVETVAANADAAGRALLADGIAALDEAGARAFVDLAEKEKLAALQAIEGLALLRGHARRDGALPSTTTGRSGLASATRGASSHLGGYIERGFDDIDWITEADAEIER